MTKRFLDQSIPERVWIQEGMGWLVPEVTCPWSGDRVLYNGNYFCEGWGRFCDWALSHPVRLPEDKAICDKLGLDYG